VIIDDDEDFNFAFFNYVSEAAFITFFKNLITWII